MSTCWLELGLERGACSEKFLYGTFATMSYKNEVAIFSHVVLIMVGNVLLPHGAPVLQNLILSRFRLSFRIGAQGDGSAKADWIPTVGQETQSTAILSAGA